MSTGCDAVWQLQRLKKALHVHNHQKGSKGKQKKSQIEGVAVRNSALQAAGGARRAAELEGQAEGRAEGQLQQASCQRDQLITKGMAYLQQRRWKWQSHPANEALAAPTCAASPTHAIHH